MRLDLLNWIIVNIKKNWRGKQTGSLKDEKQTPLKFNADIDGPSLEQQYNEADQTPEIRRGVDTETKDNERQNKGSSEASAKTTKKQDDSWLNANQDEIPTDVYKQQDDAWLNAEISQPLEINDAVLLNRPTSNRPEIKIKQDGPILDITIISSQKQDMKSEPTVFNLKINIPPQGLARKVEGPFDIEITTDDSDQSNLSLPDNLPVKPAEEPVIPDHPLLDEIAVKPVQIQAREGLALMDEINVRPVNSPICESPQPWDEIAVRPVENWVSESPVLKDEIKVRPVESLVLANFLLMDDISAKPVTNQFSGSLALMDGITVRQIDSPVLISHQAADEIAARPIGNEVGTSQALLDEITVIHVESPVQVRQQPVDEIAIRPVENIAAYGPALKDEIFIKPSPGPVNVEYKLLDDLITKRAIYRTKKAKPAVDAVITRQAERPVEKAKAVENTRVSEVVEIPDVNAEAVESTNVSEVVEIPFEKAEAVESTNVSEVVEIPIEKAEAVESTSVSENVEILNVNAEEVESPSVSEGVEIPEVNAEAVESPSVNEVVEIPNVKAEALESTGVSENVEILNVNAEEVESPSVSEGVEIPEVNAEAVESPSVNEVVEIPNVKAEALESTGVSENVEILNVNAEEVESPSVSEGVEIPEVNAEAVESPSVNEVVEIPNVKAEALESTGVSENVEIPDEREDLEQPTIPSAAAVLGRGSDLARSVDETGNLQNQAKNQDKRVESHGALTKVLATLRIFNNSEFYIQDTDLMSTDTLIQEPQIKDLTFKVLNKASEVDELIDDGYKLVMDFSNIKRGLTKGMVVFLIFVDRELASMGWACLTEDSKATLRDFPYNHDLDEQACIVGQWTNPKFMDSRISSYVKYKRQQLLKEKGFTFERSIVEESKLKELRSMRKQKGFELPCKRRTYTNVSFPGILGIEFRKEYEISETETKKSYQTATLLVLALPSLQTLPTGTANTNSAESDFSEENPGANESIVSRRD